MLRSMTEEEKLIEKLRRVEALFARPGTDGEREAAANAMARIRERLRQVERVDPPVEYKFTLPDSWSHRLLVALLRRYGVRPYRYPRQRRTTVMARISKQFVRSTLWPEFEQLHALLRSHLEEVTQRVVSKALAADTSDAEMSRRGG
jgi:hypothetical protein